LAAALAVGCTGKITPAGVGSGGAGTGAASTTGTAGTNGTLAGSAGNVGSSGGAGTGVVVGPPPAGLPSASACTSQDPGPRLVRRLTATQFSATLRDLFFQDGSLPQLSVFSDPQVLGFSSDADALLVQGLTAQQLADYAEQVAHWAVMRHMGELMPCQSNDAACRKQIITKIGKRAFREPMTDARLAPYEALMAAEATLAEGVETMLTAMLQSPYFLYRRELGTGTGATTALTQHEIASELSYLLTGSLPDDQLMQAADQGQLSTTQQLDQQVQRLLQDRRAPDALAGFFAGWLGFDRVQTVVKDDNVLKLSTSLRDAMAGETKAFLLDAFNRNAPVGDLFTTTGTFNNGELSAHYGGAPRDKGVLAHASILTGFADADISSPVLRGKMVRTRLLCGSIPPPPANVDTKLKPTSQPTTTRAHFEQHLTVGTSCAACHQLMDPIGFGFEHYDAFGRWRDQDNGFPVDASGSLRGVKEGTVTFNGLTELSTYLAGSAEVKECYSRFLAYHAYGRAAWPQDACTYDAIRTGAGAGGLRDVLTAVIHAPHFTQRSGGTK
jgi:hypothetical protein